MTVAAIVLVPDPALALADSDGEPAIRRIVQSAWAGGALPIVVVAVGAADPASALAGAVSGLQAILVEPPSGPGPGMPWFLAGFEAAIGAVAEVSAAMLWPVRHPWIDPETVTSLIEAHGPSGEAILRAAYAGEAGFPILVPAALRGALGATSALHAPDAIAELAAAGTPVTSLELGDPGIVKDASTPRSQLPAYGGPPKR